MLTGSSYKMESDAQAAYAFVCRFFVPSRTADQKGIVLRRRGEIIAAVLYDECNGQNMFMHAAAEPGRRWLTRDFLHLAFHYPFCQQRVKRVTGWVEANNLASRRFVEHLGFKLEAVLKRAGKDGCDVCLYVMFREDCRHVAAS